MIGARRRAAWTFIDQALSSLTNVALAIVVARSVTPDAFGAFSLALITYGFVVGLTRCFVGEPFIILFSAADDQEYREGVRAATGAALALGIVAGVLCLLAALIVPGAGRSALLAVAVVLPGLLVQDTWRQCFFAAQRPAAAAVNDLAWAIAQAVFLLLALSRAPTVFWITMAWGAAGLVGALLGLAQTRALPDISAGLSWLHRARSVNGRLGLAYVVNMGTIQGLLWLIGAILGLAAVAALRAAQVLLGPLNLIFSAFGAYALPAFSRRVAAGERLRRLSLLSSLALAGIATTWVAILLLVPDSLGRKLLGANWDGADAVMLPTGVLLIAAALALGASTGIMAMARVELLLRVVLVQAPLFLLSLTGAWWFGLVGAAWGFAIAQCIGATVCWWVYLSIGPSPRHRVPRRTIPATLIPQPRKAGRHGSRT